MGKRIVHGFARAVFAMLLTITWVTGASAHVIGMDTCQTLATFGATYRLTDDLFACGDCLIVAANRITIDLRGFEIVQDIGCFARAAITDGGVARELTTVRNEATFSDEVGSFDYGIDLRASFRTRPPLEAPPMGLDHRVGQRVRHVAQRAHSTAFANRDRVGCEARARPAIGSRSSSSLCSASSANRAASLQSA